MENIIAKRRTELGLSQAQLAEKVGVAKTVIGRLECGMRPLYNLRITTALKLADALGLDPHEFIKDAPSETE